MVGLLFAFMPVLAGSRGGTSDQMDVVRLLVRCATSRCKNRFILFPKKKANGQECDTRQGFVPNSLILFCAWEQPVVGSAGMPQSRVGQGGFE